MDISNHFLWVFYKWKQRTGAEAGEKNGIKRMICCSMWEMVYLYTLRKTKETVDIKKKRMEEWLKPYIKEWEEIGVVSYEKKMVLDRKKENSSLNID